MMEAMQRLARRARLAIARVVLTGVDDTTRLQAVQVKVRADEVHDRVEHFQHYGFTSVPLAGAEGIGLAVGGSTDHLVVVNVDDRRYRKKGLQPGEVCVYDMHGNFVLFKQGELLVKHTTKVTIDAPTVAVTGDLTVGGTIVAQGDVTGAGKSLAGHRHGGGPVPD